MDKEFPIDNIAKHILPNYTAGFLPGFPKEISCRGNIDILSSELLITIVGTRKPSDYGILLIEKLFEVLAKHHRRITTISGLAFGIDALTHELSLKYHIPTIAIPGSGLHDDVIGPRTNLNIAHRILKNNGLLLSPFSEKDTSRPSMFPQRNLLMAAMSNVVIVIEALTKSGSLITAHEALSYGKPVYVFPGSFFSPLSEGCHELIQKGAEVMVSFESFVEDMNLNNNQMELALLSGVPTNIWDLPHSLSELCEHFKKSPPEMLSEITLLELDGVIKNIGGRYQKVK